MKPYRFIEGKEPESYRREFELSLFNEPKHRMLQADKGWHSFHVVRDDKKKILGSVHFHLNKGVASSPFSAPFGSIEFSEHLPVEALYQFIQYVETALVKKGVTRVEIKCPPEMYASRNQNILTTLFFNRQFRINNAELGACLPVEEGFESRLDKWEQRRLKQALRAELVFKLLPNKQLKEVYTFILNCRKAKGHKLSMDLPFLSKTVSTLKSHYFLFGVFQGENLIAASVCVRVSKKIVYNFYSAHNKESDNLSPTVFLIKGIYTWCESKNISLLDLGTSALGGIPNFPLIDFKLRLGAYPSMKLTFEKELA